MRVARKVDGSEVLDDANEGLMNSFERMDM